MAIFNQLADIQVTQGGAIACKNYGGTDIPSGSGVLIDTTNVQGSNVAPGVVLPTAAGGVVGTLGITMETVPAGKTGRVMYIGAYPMIADGAITAGTVVQISDTATKMGRVKVQGAGVMQLGQALSTAADGDPCLVLIRVAKNS